MKNDITLTAFSDVGTSLNIKDDTSGKYNYFLAVENTGATGAAPEQLDVNVVGAMNKVYVAGKKDNPAKEITFFGSRDSIEMLESLRGKTKEFLQVNPDGSGFSFGGTVEYWQDDVTSGSVITGKLYITVTKAHKFISNCYSLIRDLAYIDSVIPTNITLKGTATYEITLDTYPTDATLTATSDTVGVATVVVAGKKVTITGVSAGNALITFKAAKANLADRNQTMIVFVTAA